MRNRVVQNKKTAFLCYRQFKNFHKRSSHLVAQEGKTNQIESRLIRKKKMVL